MTIELLNFPDATNTLFKQGDVITGNVRFTADQAGDYTAIGYQVIIECNIAGQKEINVGRETRFTFGGRTQLRTHFTAGETREYPVSFTVSDHPSYHGQLFEARPGVRGYAIPIKRPKVALGQMADYYPVSETWSYQLSAQQFHTNSKLALTLIAPQWSMEPLVPIGMFFSVFLFGLGLGLGLGSYGLLAIMALWIGIVYYSLIQDEVKSRVTPPTVHVETCKQMLLAQISFIMPPDDLTQLTVGYEVREQRRYFTRDGPEMLAAAATDKKPQLKVFLDSFGKTIAKHELLQLPSPKMWGNIGFEWVYQVSVKLADGSNYKWEGVMETGR